MRDLVKSAVSAAFSDPFGFLFSLAVLVIGSACIIRAAISILEGR